MHAATARKGDMVGVSGPESRFRYEESALSSIRDQPARDFLSQRGLSSGNPLFTPTDARSHTASGRDFIIIGQDGADDVEVFCVDAATGEVVITSLTLDAGVGHVNASPQAFDRCLAEFRRRCPYGDRGTSREDLETISADLGRALVAIDASTFDEDPGYWHNLLHDVAIGDYAAE
ncbi:SUKH-4 family immunity protein [Catellatospora coxensis]|uniref:SUKH-4 immunity protein of toxin-antitoxin system n=1 Tax=Catellatospora coxensis TaxID=310354 RepID=A0A8J3P632_9ACTN|nr:hypothetical protein Cco03nite_20410 [Catellatospora coxensis]